MTGSHFRVVQRFELDYAPITITQYESTRTGMRVVVAYQQGPKVSGYFTLATEIHDDSGSPHTLEHLCFMGSKSYTYKGVLDKLATRAYSNTNAWTDTDHTAYTLDTAGWDGFAQILPVYLEHVLLPTLTDAGCYTEVHHVDGTGRDAGVVYSEMQAVQNQQSSLMDLEARRLLYPQGDGFRYETGGMLDNLRVLTADRIRKFHKDMYQPKNLSLVLIGQVEMHSLLTILDRFEDGILDHVPKFGDPFQRPWIDSKRTPPLSETTIKTVEFPEDDESMGEILVSFIGPCSNNVMDDSAIRVLLTYLCDSSVAVLENVLVEKEHLCSGVWYNVSERLDLGIEFYMSAVETSKLAAVEKRFFQVLDEVTAKELDMTYLHDCLDRLKRQGIFNCEANASILSTTLIRDHLYGARDGTDLVTLRNYEEYDALMKWTDQQWRDFLSQWLTKAHHVSILGVPSKKLAQKLKAEEEARVKAQQEKLGEAGLADLAKKLQEAVAENEKPIPDEILAGFPIPDTSSIHFVQTTTARAGTATKMGKLDNEIQEIVSKDDDGIPLFIHLEHIQSKFVRLRLILDTTLVPTHLKPAITLYTSNFFATPIIRDGKKIEFEDVVMEIERDTIDYGIRSGPQHSELLQITFEVESSKYEVAIKWLRTMLFDSVFDAERLNASLTKLLADIPDEKRNGSSMCSSIATMNEFVRESVSKADDTLVKALYLRRLKAMLVGEPQTVIDQLEEVAKIIRDPSNYRVFVAADLQTLKAPVSSWKTLVASKESSDAPRPIVDRSTLLTETGRNPGNTAYVVPLPAIDSSYGDFVVKGVSSHDHADLPALMVAGAYLDAVEGPLWVAVRGTGLAYGTHYTRSISTGRLTYRIYRSPDCFKAWEASKKQVLGLASGKIPLDKFALEGAISSIVQNFVNEQPTAGSSAINSFLYQVVLGIDKDWNDHMLKAVRAVTPDQVRESLDKYYSKVFEPTKTNVYITCAKIMEEGLLEKFKAEGFNPVTRQLTDFEDDYGLKHVEGEEDLDDDEEGDEEGDEGEDGDEEGDEEGSDDAMSVDGKS